VGRLKKQDLMIGAGNTSAYKLGTAGMAQHLF